MMTQSIINQMLRDAERAAGRFASDFCTPQARMAYVKGVRDMAGLIIACANAAQELCDEQKAGSISHTMLKGYADGLRHIAEGADDLIPPGYEY